MRKLFTLTLAILASFNLWAYTAPAEGTYDLTSESTAKVSSSGRFVVISEGLYAYRPGSGYSYSNGNGLKTQSNQGGFVFCLNAETNVTFTIKHTESKNAHTATMKIYSISEAQYKEFDDNKAAATKSQTIDVSGITPTNFDITITAETKDFTGTTTLSAGYYSVVPTGEKGNTYFKAIGFELLPATDPVTEVTIEGPTKGPKDYAATFSATTDVKADSYQWFVNNVEQPGATAKTFNFTPTAVGDYSIVCKARNANNAEGAWIASDVIAFKALNTLFGELIKATLTSGSAATVTGIIGGTADVSLSDSKKMDKKKYFGITLASGKFHEGDTVVIKMTAAGQNYPCLFADKDRATCLFLATETSTALEYKIVLPAAANSLSSIYVARDENDEVYKWNPVLSSMSVIRPMATKSITESLTAVAINDAAISATDLATLQADHAVAVADAYVDAPEVKFTKHVTYIYEDDSQVETDEIVAATASEVAGAWQAKATINNIEYTVSAVKLSSVVVTYMDGESELGTENVAVGGHPAQYAQYQSKSLYSFAGWYNNADLAPEHAVTIAEEVINDDATYYAKFEKAYASSINIEALILANGKSYNTKAQLGALHYASNYSSEGMDISNDSLNNGKGAYRNYDYLGLKIKSVSLLNFRIANGKTVKMKFGDVKTTPQVSINGGDYAPITITDGVYTHTAGAEEVISFKVTEGNKAVVLKQIVIGDAPELEDVVYAINYAATTNGTVSGWTIALPTETVTLTLAPADGYKIASVKYNDGSDHTIEPENQVYSFTMPAAAVTVSATFSLATALDNTDVNAKAVKRLENGILVIEKNGRLFNAQGQLVK